MDIGQGEEAPAVLWVCFDKSNGHGNYRYLWWSKTKKGAQEELKFSRKNKDNAALTAPVKYCKHSKRGVWLKLNDALISLKCGDVETAKLLIKEVRDEAY